MVKRRGWHKTVQGPVLGNAFFSSPEVYTAEPSFPPCRRDREVKVLAAASLEGS